MVQFRADKILCRSVFVPTYVHMYIVNFCRPSHKLLSRLTIVSQEEAGRTRRTSELFTGSTTLKLVNTLNKPP